MITQLIIVFLVNCLFMINSSTGYVTSEDCIDIPVIQDFSALKYSGSWYEIQRAGVLFEYILKCVTAEYGYVNATTLTVTNSGLSVIGNLQFNTTGTGYSRSRETPNKLYVEFDNGSVGDYNVWDTDYSTFSIVYSCKPTTVLGKKMNEVNAWILSRTSSLDQGLVDKYKAFLSAGGVDVNQVTGVDQTCSK